MLEKKFLIIGIIISLLLTFGCAPEVLEPSPTVPAPTATPSRVATPDLTPSPSEVAPTPAAPLPAKTGILEVYITDALPEQVSAVLVKAKKIEVHKAEDGKWITVIEAPPSFDLVKIAGVEEFLGGEQIEAGRYTQVRLEIVEVTATIEGKEVKATVPSGKLKLVGTFFIEEGKKTVITLDFDAEKSLVLRGKKEPLFKPVVKLIVERPKKE